MRITRIDFEGKPGHYATAQRRANAGNVPHIVVTLLTPDMPEGREHFVTADCEEDIRSMAECLQHHLDGCRGTNSDIHEYFRELQRFQD